MQIIEKDMTMKTKFIHISLLGLMLGACGVSEKSSEIKGHYESSSAAIAKRFVGEQKVPAEYSESQAVIVSQPLLTSYGREDLVKAILDAGVPKVYMAVPRGSSTSLSSSVYRPLRKLLGTAINRVQLLPQKASGTLTVWARDWSPLGAIARDGSLRLLDLNYYPSRPADDSTSQTLEGFAGLSRVSLPVYNEGGNFMTNGRGECLMTTRVTDANAAAQVFGDLVLDAEAVKSYYEQFAGCSSVHIFPRMPNEKTGHIDMWAKFLDDDTVIVNQISDSVINASGSSSARTFGRSIQAYFEARAKEMAALGYRVVRIGAPLPSLSYFRSYTNSLLVNGTAIIPSYDQTGSDAVTVARLEKEAKAVYESLGYRTKFIPSEQLIRTGGAIHCVTQQLPAAL